LRVDRTVASLTEDALVMLLAGTQLFLVPSMRGPFTSLVCHLLETLGGMLLRLCRNVRIVHGGLEAGSDANWIFMFYNKRLQRNYFS
jgi:hypothetical protein